MTQKMRVLICSVAISAASLQAANTPLKVYILVGQSNMQGHAVVKTLPHMQKDSGTRALHDKIVDQNGKPKIYMDVCVAAFSGRDPENVIRKNGPLTIGYGKELGDNNSSFGPELGFGITMVEHLEEPILLIKIAWGGKSLSTDFRPPSAGPYQMHAATRDAWAKRPEGAHGIPAEKDRPEWWKQKREATGVYYRLMMACVKEVLADPSTFCAAYNPDAGYEIAGFVWFQGWNDMVDSTTYSREGIKDRYKTYTEDLVHFIRDVRNELNAPDMPFVIGVMGVGGLKETRQRPFREAMAAPAGMDEFKGNVFAVQTAPFWDEEVGEFDQLIGEKKREAGAEWKKKVDAMPDEEREALHRYAGQTFSQERVKALLIEELGERKYNELTTARGNAGYHYMGSAKTLGQIGQAFAEALLTGINGVQAEAIPDLIQGQGPTVEEAAKNDWYLQCEECRGWAYRDPANRSDAARQILITKVPAEAAVRRDLKVGDVILGVGGTPFSGPAIRQFREASRVAQEAQAPFPVLMWRQGWDKPRHIDLNLAPLPLDFTKGDRPGEARDFNLGPMGARGWIQARDLSTADARQILVTAVEKGSPADGLLQADDVILGIAGKPFDSDVRKVLAAAIRQAETKAGNNRLELLCWREGKTKTIIIHLPVLGDYSPSAPFNCGKSKTIVDAAANYIVTNGMGDGVNGCVNALGLLATGEKKYLPAVKEFATQLQIEGVGMPTWNLGYANILFTEYYLATGDKDFLPKIRKVSQTLAEGQSKVGTFGHGFANPENGILPAYGAVNQGSLSAMISLALARKCGVTSEAIERAVNRAAIFFRYYIDKGSIPYGDHRPYLETHDNNGVCSSAAVFFDLIDDEPGARYFSRMATASYGIREAGHTGHFWSHLWAAPGVNRGGKQASIAFLNELWWYFDLERRWDGGFKYQPAPGSNGGGEWDCTGARLLVYTLPRRAIYLTGRGMTETDRLTGDALQATIAAGRGVNWGNRMTRYDGQPSNELFELLGSWSPIVRKRAAMSLGKQPGNATPGLLKMFRTGNINQKLGVLVALQHQGTRAAQAVAGLTKLLTYKDANMRIAAINALQGIGPEAKTAVPEMLRVARMRFPDDPRNLTRRNIGYVLFNDALLDLDTVDRNELFAAVQDLIRVDDGRARGHVGWLYKKLSFDALKPILPDILWAVENPSPSGTMFASNIRDAGLKLLSENRVAEGIPLLVQYARDQSRWGSQDRIVQIMSMLERYGVHAQRVLPELRELTDYFRTEPDFPEWARKKKVEAMEASIKRIEAATEKPELVRL